MDGEASEGLRKGNDIRKSPFKEQLISSREIAKVQMAGGQWMARTGFP